MSKSGFSYETNTLYSLIAKLGINSVQNYVLTLGRALSGLRQLPDKSNMSDILDFGAEVLQYMLDNGLVRKEGHSSSKSNSNRLVIDIVPNIEIDELVEATKSVYPIRTINTNRVSEIILHDMEIVKINKKNVDLLKQQNNIPLLIRKVNTKGSVRTPKNIDNANNPNYLLETALIESYINDYDEKTVFMNHSYDRRGRMYSMSYPLSFQSDEMTRSVIELAFKELVNNDGIVWLKRDIANLAGLDKHTHSRKEEWFDAYEDRIIHIGKLGELDKTIDIICECELDKPIRFVSACKAYVNAIEGKPTGYMCSIDSTASGSQIMALLTRDELAAKYCNLSSEDKRYDIYSEVAREFYRLKKEPNRFKYLADRKRFKSSVMISGYNGKVAVETNFPDEKERALFYEAMNNVCKGAKEITELINQAYLDNSDKPYMSWVMPDGFQVSIPQFKPKWKRVLEKDFDIMFKYEIVEPYVKGNKRSLMPNFIHSVDSYICRELLRRLGEREIEVMSVHDSFYSHPNNMSVILKTYNETLQEINSLKVDLVANFLTDIYGEKKANPFAERKQLDDIRFAKYSLC